MRKQVVSPPGTSEAGVTHEADNKGDPSINDLIAAATQAANAEAAMSKIHVCNQGDVAMHGRCQFVGQHYSVK